MPRKKALDHFRKELRNGSRSEELPVKQISVMADSKEGLEEGLETAEELLDEGLPAEMMSDESEDSEMDESEELPDLDNMSIEEMKEFIRTKMME